ncbi:hypothetical protein THAOC_33696, partial [Thalassiosira oceanica]
LDLPTSHNGLTRPWNAKNMANCIPGLAVKPVQTHLAIGETCYLDSFDLSCLLMTAIVWRRSRHACIKLKECIGNRPKVGDSSFSSEFEKYVVEFAISDAKNQTQCSNARVKMGYYADYDDDVVICNYFEEVLCSGHFHAMDAVVNASGREEPGNHKIKYHEPVIPTAPKLTYNKLTKKPVLADPTWDRQATIDAIEDSITALDYTEKIETSVMNFALGSLKDTCDAMPTTIGLGVFPDPLKIACEALHETLRFAKSTMENILALTKNALNLALSAENKDKPSYEVLVHKNLINTAKYVQYAFGEVNHNTWQVAEESRDSLKHYLDQIYRNTGEYTLCVVQKKTCELRNILAEIDTEPLTKHACATDCPVKSLNAEVSQSQVALDIIDSTTSATTPKQQTLKSPKSILQHILDVEESLGGKVDLIMNELGIDVDATRSNNPAGPSPPSPRPSWETSQVEQVCKTSKVEQECKEY